ncbi:MAG: ferritin-like domain-containing protein [Actinomycetota bacterium]|nr:ferritin-like domain-containing protein [Actinomycetota bacterium]
MSRGRQQIIKYLMEAHAHELGLITTLNAHIRLAAPGSYKRLLEQHLRETQDHAERVERRLQQLGAHKSLIQSGIGTVHTLIGQGIVLAKGPMDMIRGKSLAEKMLKNARDESMTEILEISTYETIENLASSLGDLQTAELAALIRQDEERMLQGLRDEIPNLTAALLEEEVPPSERAAAGLKQPWPGYDDQTVDEIQRRLAGSPEVVRAKVREYERSHKKRKTVIETAEREPASV